MIYQSGNRILAGLLALICGVAFIYSDPAFAQTRIAPVSQTQMKLSFAPVVKSIAPSVVNIYTKRSVSMRVASPFFNDPFFNRFFGQDNFGGHMKEQIESSLGSGVIVEKEGVVITNAHVIKDAVEITVGLSDGREIDARVSVVDEASDLAVLRLIDPPRDLQVAAMGQSQSLEVGDIVLAIGNPFGVGQTVTSGIVSAQGRSSLNINDFNFFIQTDAAINPGNSGGPLVDLDGRVVGINTAIYSRDGGSLGIGFAIPTDMVRSVLAAERMANDDGVTLDRVQRAWLGVSAQNVTSDIAESLGLEQVRGVLIVNLHPKSPLKKSGLEVGDVVTHMGDQDIRDSSEMKFRMATVPLGDSVKIRILRRGVPHEYRVKSMTPPDDPPREETQLSGKHIFNGVNVANLNPAVADELGFDASEDTKDRVVVMDVKTRSAYRVVRRGDVIVQINGDDVEDVTDVQKALKSYRDGDGWQVVIERDGQVRQVLVR